MEGIKWVNAFFFFLISVNSIIIAFFHDIYFIFLLLGVDMHLNHFIVKILTCRHFVVDIMSQELYVLLQLTICEHNKGCITQRFCIYYCGIPC